MQLTPEYKKLGELVAKDPKLSGRVVVAKVWYGSPYLLCKLHPLLQGSISKWKSSLSQANADAHRSLGEKFEVTGFPTIKFLPRGKAPNKDTAEAYNGARTAEAFFEFLQKKVCDNKSTTLTTAD